MKQILALVFVLVLVDGRILDFTHETNSRVKRDAVEGFFSVLETGINAASETVQQGMGKATEMGSNVISGAISIPKIPENISTTGMGKASETVTSIAETFVKPFEKAIETFGGVIQNIMGSVSS